MLTNLLFAIPSAIYKGFSLSIHCKVMDQVCKIIHAVGTSTNFIFNKGTSTFRGKMVEVDNFTVFFLDLGGI